MTYPYFNETFKIHTIDSAFQLGAFISQKDEPIAFYSRKITDAQPRYTVTQRELPNMIETLKEYRTILIGHKLGVYTNNKNLACENFHTDIVLRWRLVLE